MASSFMQYASVKVKIGEAEAEKEVVLAFDLRDSLMVKMYLMDGVKVYKTTLSSALRYGGSFPGMSDSEFLRNVPKVLMQGQAGFIHRLSEGEEPEWQILEYRGVGYQKYCEPMQFECLLPEDAGEMLLLWKSTIGRIGHQAGRIEKLKMALDQSKLDFIKLSEETDKLSKEKIAKETKMVSCAIAMVKEKNLKLKEALEREAELVARCQEAEDRVLALEAELGARRASLDREPVLDSEEEEEEKRKNPALLDSDDEEEEEQAVSSINLMGPSQTQRDTMSFAEKPSLEADAEKASVKEALLDDLLDDVMEEEPVVKRTDLSMFRNKNPTKKHGAQPSASQPPAKRRRLDSLKDDDMD